MVAKNPFPGMNPYLEQRWGDVHAALVTYTRDVLQDQLPEGLRARMQERVFVEATAEAQRSLYPDVYVYERRNNGGGDAGAASAGGTAVADPLVIHVPDVEATESYLEIIDARSGGRVITLIEFVSRSNKAPGPGRELYVQKQRETRQAAGNLVEIDLLRGGRPVTLALPHFVPETHHTPYHAAVYRGQRPGLLDYYAAPLRQPLPKIRVPLRPDDADVALDLQELIDLCYQRGRYDDIDYTRAPQPPLEPADAEWAQAVLKAASGR